LLEGVDRLILEISSSSGDIKWPEEVATGRREIATEGDRRETDRQTEKDTEARRHKFKDQRGTNTPHTLSRPFSPLPFLSLSSLSSYRSITSIFTANGFNFK
jgi:hypothetical protein